MQQKVTAQIGANQISIETGKIARLADGAVVVTCGDLDRKSTRLNSSHVRISYAVFCLKKKKIRDTHLDENDYVYASIPANTGKNGTVICFCTQFDTSPDCTCHVVHPSIVRNYRGVYIV